MLGGNIMSYDNNIIVDTEFTEEPDDAEKRTTQEEDAAASAAGTAKSAACGFGCSLKNGMEYLRDICGKTNGNTLLRDPRLIIKHLDKLLQWAKTTFPAEQFKLLSDFCINGGHIALIAAQLITLLLGISAMFKLGSFLYFLYGLCLTLLLVVMQFVADRFINAGDRLIASSPSSLASNALPDCTALISEVTGLLLFVMFLFQAAAIKSWSLIWVGIGVLAFFDALSYIALHPALINLSKEEEQNAGQEAIGIMSFYAKCLLKIVPLAFGICGVAGVLGMLFGFVSFLRTGQILPVKLSYQLVFTGTLLPLVSYIIFAFYHLMIDVLKSLMSLARRT